jgi:signal transduction histidine kinase/ActR/RegA family two-component response regulator
VAPNHSFFSIPVFDDEDKTRIANLLSVTIFTLFVIALVRTLLAFWSLPQYFELVIKVNSVLFVVFVLVFAIMRTGHVRFACIIFTVYQWITIAWITYNHGGLDLSIFSFFIFVILAAGLLLGGKWAVFYATISTLFGVLLLYLSHLGMITPVEEGPMIAFSNIAPSFITTAVLVYLYNRDIVRALMQARINTTQLAQVNEQLTHEISARERVEIQLLQAQRMEAMGTLAGGIAHDFNNILSPIMAHSEMAIMDLPEGSPIQQNLLQIRKAVERARDLVRQILTFARKREKERIPLKASLTVKEAIKFLKSTIPSTIDIQYNCKTEEDMVLGDPTEMNRIVMNLCTNAAHAMRENGGTLEVILKDEFFGQDNTQFTDLASGHYLRISVRDTGPGIPPEIIDRIFEPYFTTKGPSEGTGLGLAVVHGIVKNYEGNISVDSEVGKGTTFHVILPLVEEEIPLVDESKAHLPRGNEHLLLIDDEIGIIHTQRLMLERLGYRVTTITDSIEALETFRNNPDEFDLVITDMTMPNMTGKDLAKKLIRIRSDIPIILCTGFSEQINERIAKEIGISAFVMKPIAVRDLANTIREVLTKKQPSSEQRTDNNP